MLPTTDAILAQRDTLLNGVVLTDSLVDKLMDYMSALTDDARAQPQSTSCPTVCRADLAVIPRHP